MFRKMTTTAVVGLGLMGLALPATATVPAEVTEWHTWETQLVNEGVDPQSASDVTWPQTYVGPGQVTPPCGVWYQQDTYKGTREQIDAVLADGLLVMEPEGPEDRHIVQEWVFVYGGDCPVPDEPETPIVVDPPLPTLPPTTPVPVQIVPEEAARAANPVVVEPTFTG